MTASRCDMHDTVRGNNAVLLVALCEVEAGSAGMM
jgi:hypothetical protein